MSATTSATNTAAQNGTPSYVARAIDLTITLGTGTFGATGQNTVKLSGLRIVANIVKGGFPSMDRAELQVYGVPLAIMQSVSTLGINPAQVRDHNDLLIEAGDAINGMSVVYNGHIQDA